MVTKRVPIIERLNFVITNILTLKKKNIIDLIKQYNFMIFFIFHKKLIFYKI